MLGKSSRLGLLLLCICVWISRLIAGPMTAQNEGQAMDYLTEFGYLKAVDARAGRLRTEKEVVDAIRTFQLYAGIPMTGKVDEKTMEMIKMPRCGMSDFGRSDSARRRRRYAVQGTHWNKRQLTYKFLGGPTKDISMSEVEREMTKAFNEWQRVTNIKFIKVDDPQADILVRFSSGMHGDGYPFDGTGGTLAHGFYPHNNEGLSGDVHFDDDEQWVLTKQKSGTDFYWTALHEIGHSLGLDHSNYKQAVMYPFYTGFKDNLALNEDDIEGIRHLYGTPEVTIQTARPPTMILPSSYPPGVPNPCDTFFDAVLAGADDVTYFFTGKYYWTVVVNGERNGPFFVTDKWKKLPADGIDAAYQSHGEITFFKGKYCWVYNGTEYIEGPIAISKKFMLDPSVDSIDAAFVWGANGKTYLFKDDMYWRYNEAFNSLDMGYPVRINDSWVDIPNNIDAAMTWINGKTYFFKGRGFRIFDNTKIAVANDEPMKTSMYWMKCSSLDSSAGLNVPRVSQAFVVIVLGMLLSAITNL